MLNRLSDRLASLSECLYSTVAGIGTRNSMTPLGINWVWKMNEDRNKSKIPRVLSIKQNNEPCENETSVLCVVFVLNMFCFFTGLICM